jgi:hypothetical protein
MKALRLQIVAALDEYEIRAGSPELYQDSTGLVSFRVTAKGDSGPFAPTLAWIVLSHTFHTTTRLAKSMRGSAYVCEDLVGPTDTLLRA